MIDPVGTSFTNRNTRPVFRFPIAEGISTGVHEVADKSRISFAPNPAHNAVSITTNTNARSVVLLDALGRMVVDRRITALEASNPIRLSLGGIPAGCYTLRTDDAIGNHIGTASVIVE